MQQDQMNRLAAAGMAAAQLSTIQRADFSCRLLQQLLTRLYEDQVAQIECSSTARKKAAALAVALADDLLEMLRVTPGAVMARAAQLAEESPVSGTQSELWQRMQGEPDKPVGG